MATNLTMFLRKNALPIITEKYVASTRFTQEVDGKPVPVEWEIRPVTNAKDEQLRKDSTEWVKTGKRGQRQPEMDVDKYAAKVCVASTIFPDLNDAALQDDYGVKSAEDLIKAMLTPGEYNMYKQKVLEVNGYNSDMDELVEDAKN